MKKSLIVLISILFLASCSSEEKLNKETALKILKENQVYPKTNTYSIFITAPAFAKRMIDAGLEEEGLLTVRRTQKLTEVGEPLIVFTKKAEPYLVTQTEEDKGDRIQRVKIADEEIGQVTRVQMVEGQGRAVVEYTTTFKNISPFSKLSKLELDEGSVHKVGFVHNDTGWKIENLSHNPN